LVKGVIASFLIDFAVVTNGNETLRVGFGEQKISKNIHGMQMSHL
jgi:hypothetical protein